METLKNSDCFYYIKKIILFLRKKLQMLLKSHLKRFFSNNRIDFKQWLRHHENMSKAKPEVLYEDNPEYLTYKRKAK